MAEVKKKKEKTNTYEEHIGTKRHWKQATRGLKLAVILGGEHTTCSGLGIVMGLQRISKNLGMFLQLTFLNNMVLGEAKKEKKTDEGHIGQKRLWK